METKTLVKRIKAKDQASNVYVFMSVLSGIGTALLSVLLVHLLFAGELTREGMWRIGAGIIVLQIAKAVFNAVGIRQPHLLVLEQAQVRPAFPASFIFPLPKV